MREESEVDIVDLIESSRRLYGGGSNGGQALNNIFG